MCGISRQDQPADSSEKFCHVAPKGSKATLINSITKFWNVVLVAESVQFDLNSHRLMVFFLRNWSTFTDLNFKVKLLIRAFIRHVQDSNSFITSLKVNLFMKCKKLKTKAKRRKMIRFNRWKWFCRNFKTITNQFLSDIPWKIIKSLSIMSKRPPKHKKYGLELIKINPYLNLPW